MDDVDREQALAYLLRFLAVEGTTGHERAIGEEIAAALRELGVAADAIRDDGAHRRIPLPTEAGNLVVSLPGDPGVPARLFVAHRDTVPLCAGATNVVTDFVRVEGEARSHDERFVGRIVDAYRRAFTGAAARLPNSDGEHAEVAFSSRTTYHPFRLGPQSPSVVFAADRATSLGLVPTLRVSDGGLDANWLAHHGIPTVTFGAGQRGIHTLDEHVVLADYFAACRLAVALARA